MKTINSVGFFLLLFLCNIGCSSQKIISRPLPNNPTGYIFKVNIKDARFKLSKNLEKNNIPHCYVHDVYYHGTWKRSSWPEVATNALVGEDNKYDVYLEIAVDTSDIYHGKKNRPLGYEMKCVAHFTTIDSNTSKLEIRILESKVHLRDRLLPSPPHFVNNPVYKFVMPTTIEEYKILRCLGAAFGMIDQMQPLKT